MEWYLGTDTFVCHKSAILRDWWREVLSNSVVSLEVLRPAIEARKSSSRLRSIMSNGDVLIFDDFSDIEFEPDLGPACFAIAESSELSAKGQEASNDIEFSRLESSDDHIIDDTSRRVDVEAQSVHDDFRFVPLTITVASSEVITDQ